MNDVIPPPLRAVIPIQGREDPHFLINPISLTLISERKISSTGWHDHFQLWYLASGEYIHTVNNVRYIQKAGDVIIIPPFAIHNSDLSISDMSELKLIRIKINHSTLSSETFPLFPFSYQNAVFKNKLLPIFHSFSGSEKELADSIMERIIQETSKNLRPPVNKLLPPLAEFLDLYAAKAEKEIPSDKLAKVLSRIQTVNDAVNYISQNSSDSSLSIDDIAAHVNMSRRSLTNAFYELVGRTVHSYIMSIRLFNAYITLRSSNQSISEIAENCGFANSSHLSSSFKKEFGCTPLQFRREYCDWQIKYGDVLYKNAINSMKGIFEPDEDELIRHWTSMNFMKNV